MRRRLTGSSTSAEAARQADIPAFLPLKVTVHPRATANVANVAAGGSGAYSDAVQFKSTAASNTFNVDLPNGLYQVKVVTGNVSRTTIKMENMLQMINLTGNNAEETIQIPVTDGQLNIQAVEGRSGTAFSISAVEIAQLNTTGKMKPTIWLCGDSTVANYYNTADTAQHGWGQFLNRYVDTSKWEVRNMAASGTVCQGICGRRTIYAY